MIVPKRAIEVVDFYTAQLTSRKVKGKPATDMAKGKFKYGVLNLVSQVYKEPLNLNTKFVSLAVGHNDNRRLFSQISNELFNTTTYKVGHHSKQYSLKDTAHPVKLVVPKGLDAYINAYRKALTVYWIKADPWCAMQFNLMQAININTVSAWADIKSTYPSAEIAKGLASLPAEVNKDLAFKWYETGQSGNLKRLPIETQDALKMHFKREAAEKFLRLWAVSPNDRKLFVKRSIITWRIYSTFNQSPKLIRKSLFLDGEGLKNLDLVKSHPTILVSCIWSVLNERKKEGGSAKNCDNSLRNKVFLGSNSKKDLFQASIAKAMDIGIPTLPYYCAPTFSDTELRNELVKYYLLNAAENKEEAKDLQGELEFKAWGLCSKQQDKDACPTRRRYTRGNFIGQFKSAQLYWLNGDPNSLPYKSHFFNSAFYSEFPFISSLIELLKTRFALDTAQGATLKKGKNFSALAITLQRVEAEIMQGTFDGLEVLLVHDEICYNSRVSEDELKARISVLPKPLKLEFK